MFLALGLHALSWARFPIDLPDRKVDEHRTAAKHGCGIGLTGRVSGNCSLHG
jgi:hypothetical protein